VITPNLDQLRLYRRHPELRAMYEDAGLVLADGMPLVWASRIAKTPLPERVAGSTLLLTLSEAAAENGLSIFLLGGNAGAAELAGKELVRRFPALQMAGTYFPPFGFEKNDAEVQKIRQAIGAAKPRIVFVGIGFPKQEHLITDLRAAFPEVWFLGIGISFSFVAGQVRRAPLWMQKCGLEWLHRLYQEPGRLFSRYILHDLPFSVRLMAWAIGKRFGNSG
jgi:N-acetylglucosaminyldiphosphoundecaprenol N-acetyl-beta-D-mannosaminyltransferase